MLDILDDCNITLLVALLVVGLFLAIALQFFIPRADSMVIKIIRADLPECETTIGTPSGYYCAQNNTSYFCKVDSSQPDPYVRTHPYCEAVYLT
jgi:hypothetical protein